MWFIGSQLAHVNWIKSTKEKSKVWETYMEGRCGVNLHSNCSCVCGKFSPIMTSREHASLTVLIPHRLLLGAGGEMELLFCCCCCLKAVILLFFNYVWGYVHLSSGGCGGQRCWLPWRSYRHLVWVLGLDRRSSARDMDVPNLWATSPAQEFLIQVALAICWKQQREKCRVSPLVVC